MQIFDIKDTHGTPYQSTTQGRVEAFNKKINIALRVSLNEQQLQDYDLYIDSIVFTLNCLKSSRNGFSSNYLAFNRECAVPTDLFAAENERIDNLQVNEADYRNIVEYRKYRELCEINRKVIENSERKAMYMKTQHDKKIRGPYPDKGDYVMLLIDKPKHKLSKRYEGPWLVKERINLWNYVVHVKDKDKIVNITKIKPYHVNRHSKVEKERQLSSSEQKERAKMTKDAEKKNRKQKDIVESSSSDTEGEHQRVQTRAKTKKSERKKGRIAQIDRPPTTEVPEHCTTERLEHSHIEGPEHLHEEVPEHSRTEEPGISDTDKDRPTSSIMSQEIDFGTTIQDSQNHKKTEAITGLEKEKEEKSNNKPNFSFFRKLSPNKQTVQEETVVKPKSGKKIVKKGNSKIKSTYNMRENRAATKFLGIKK